MFFRYQLATVPIVIFVIDEMSIEFMLSTNKASLIDALSTSDEMNDVSIVHKKNTYTHWFQFSGVGDHIQDISWEAEMVIWDYASSSA